MRAVRRVGATVVALIVLMAVFAPQLATNDPDRQFRDRLLAPPTVPRIVDESGRWHRPFVHPLRLVDPLERRYEHDASRRIPLQFFSGGHAVTSADAAEPWLPLGADRLGRDVWSRVVHGARVSLAVAAVASLGALLLGVLAGAIAGYCGGAIDRLLMRLSELVLILPVLYVVLAARSSLPHAIDTAAVFVLLTCVLALLGWPWVARGVRAVVAAEAARDHALAARALGAGPVRLLARHLLPAAGGFVRAQALQLLPAAILAEATLSFAGLGFGAGQPSWGALLQEAADIRAIADFPWLLSAAAVIVVLVLGVNLATLADERPGPLRHRMTT
jgi:peptide/nickel transport system permease protein